MASRRASVSLASKWPLTGTVTWRRASHRLLCPSSNVREAPVVDHPTTFSRGCRGTSCAFITRMTDRIDGGVPLQVPLLPDTSDNETNRYWGNAPVQAANTVVPWAADAHSPDGGSRAPTAGVAQPGDATGSTRPAISEVQLSAIFPHAHATDVAHLAMVLNAHASEFGLDLGNREAVAHFLAQVGTESNLHPQRENMNYSVERLAVTWPSRFGPDAGIDAGAWAHQPQALGNSVYDGRMGNDAGEGYFFRGGGLLQTTGRDGYQQLQQAIDHRRLGDAGAVNVVTAPDQIDQGDLPQLSALFYFQQRVLPLASDGGFPSVRAVTQAVNGGQNGAAERAATFRRALEVLSAHDAGH